MIACSPEPASFRDPSGQVFIRGERVFRTVMPGAAADYEFVRDQRLIARLADEGRLIPSAEVAPDLLGPAQHARYLLEHARIGYVSFPYEWSFPALKAAALLHLELHLELLEHDVTLSDASAYNVQFQGARPIFIDLLSLRRYREGEYWVGHRQFCEQFLNPLLLRALAGVPQNAWYRGSLEGIPVLEIDRVLPLRRKLSWNVISHVMLQAKLHRAAIRKPQANLEQARARQLSKTAFRGLLTQLSRWIARLEPADTGPTVWGSYAETHSYRSEEEQAKRRFVAEFIEHTRPGLLFDLGCNTGDYSALALEAGAGRVVGFDADQQALETAFARAAAAVSRRRQPEPRPGLAAGRAGRLRPSRHGRRRAGARLRAPSGDRPQRAARPAPDLADRARAARRDRVRAQGGSDGWPDAGIAGGHLRGLR